MGINNIAHQDQGQQTSLSQSFQNKMNIQRTLDIARNAVAGGNGGFGDDLGGTESIRNLSPLRSKPKAPKTLAPLAPHLSGRVGSLPTGPPRSLKADSNLTASERVRQRDANRGRKNKARRDSRDSDSLPSGLEDMSDEQLSRLSSGMEELKKMAQDAERQARLDALKEELEMLEAGSPIHQHSPHEPPPRPNLSPPSSPRRNIDRRPARQERPAAYSPPASPRREHPRQSHSVMNNYDDRYAGAQDYSLQNVPLSPTKGILKRTNPPPAAHGNDRDKDRDERYVAKYDYAGKEIVERRYGAEEYRSELPPLSIKGGGRDADRDYNRDKARASYYRDSYDDKDRGANDPYASPRSKREQRAREQKTSPENKLAIQKLRSDGGKFFANDYEGGYSTSTQRTYRAPLTNRRSMDPDMVFGVKTAREKYRESGAAAEGSANSEQLSPSQRLHRSCPFATQPDLEEIAINRAGGVSKERPSHPYPYPGGSHKSVDKYSRDNTASTAGGGVEGVNDEKWNQKAFTNSKQPYEPRTFATESKRVTRPW